MRPKAYSYIRMSTDLQLKGDSLRRQLEGSKAYAQAHDLELVEGEELQDIGVSAFKGANVSDGAFGRFLAAVQEGQISPGSYLLIESFDRVSRQPVPKALQLFLQLIEAGINVVTLMDKRVYSSDGVNAVDVTSLISSIVIMSRAHEESLTKSQRVAQAWANKRANASKKPLTAKCPAWLKLSPDRTRYEVIPDRASVVRSIFEDAANGIGVFASTRRLNQSGVAPFTDKSGWHKSYLVKILGNRAVLGEFQPHQKVAGRRIPVGEPITDYFPAIIEEELFYRAKEGRDSRRKSGRGRKGPNVTNLFGSLARCAYCGSSMTYVSKGPAPKGGSYLVCYDGHRGRGCSPTGWRYDQFETSFLAFVEELDLESILIAGSEVKRRDLSNAILVLTAKLTELDREREHAYQLWATGVATEFVAGKLQENENKRVEFRAQLAEKQKQMEESEAHVSAFYQSRTEIKALIERMLRPVEGDDIYKLRSQISARIKSVVASLHVAPLGDEPRMKKIASILKSDYEDEEVAEYINNLSQMNRDRYFAIGFKDNSVRAVYPDSQDPLKYAVQVIAAKNMGMIRIEGGTGGAETGVAVPAVLVPSDHFEPGPGS